MKGHGESFAFRGSLYKCARIVKTQACGYSINLEIYSVVYVTTISCRVWNLLIDTELVSTHNTVAWHCDTCRFLILVLSLENGHIK